MRTLKKYLPIIVGKRILFLFLLAPKKAVHKAFVLFCTPRKGQVSEDQAYFLEEAEDEVVIFKQLKIQTYRWPNIGPTIMLVHGWDSNTHRWKTLVEKLHQLEYTVIAFDAPAHGYSSGKTLNVPLYTECVQKIVELYRPNHIVGHSLGAMATIFHQFNYPDSEIEKLVVLAPPTKFSSIINGYQKTLRLSDKFITALSLYFKELFGFYFKEFSMAEFAKNIKKPGLLIHDKNDKIAPYNEAEEIAKNWENIQFITTEDFGHSLFFDEVDDAIIDFLKEDA